MTEAIDNTNFKQLNETLKQIRQISMIKTRQFDQVDLEHFEELLNSAQPKTEADIAQARLVRYLASHSPKKTSELFNELRAHGLILWMDARSLINQLRLHNLVFIQWNKDTGKYDVQKYDPQKKFQVVSRSSQE